MSETNVDHDPRRDHERDPATAGRDPVALSVSYLRRVRAGDETDHVRRALANLDPDDLTKALDDGATKSFWLNVYNAVVQETLDEDPGQFQNRRTFFGRELVEVAGTELSLDGIEHGILRRSQVSVGLGYVRWPGFLVDEFERRMRVESVDPRIHFALNCGAASCPSIAAYTRTGIDDELDLATARYFETEIEYDPDAGVVRVPRLLLWYRGDFGGRSGIYRFLREYDAIPRDAKPRVKYGGYDWSLSLGDYTDSHI